MKELMTTGETSQYVRHAVQTLAKWRCYGLGPRYVRVGRSILYDRADVDAWLETRMRRSTSDLASTGDEPKDARV
ncbi:MAG TPA: helix-turn-helix domain-containing protein [Gemmatimonadaceae bacterium]